MLDYVAIVLCTYRWAKREWKGKKKTGTRMIETIYGEKKKNTFSLETCSGMMTIEVAGYSDGSNFETEIRFKLLFRMSM